MFYEIFYSKRVAKLIAMKVLIEKLCEETRKILSIKIISLSNLSTFARTWHSINENHNENRTFIINITF